MTTSDTIGKNLAGFAKPEKRKMMVLAVFFGVIIICVIGVVFLVQSSAGSGTTQPPVQGNSTRPDQGTYPFPNPRITLTYKQTVTQTVRQTQTPSTPAPEKKPVDFILQPGPQTSCGLTCRQLTATITNTGDETAHNVCITLVVHNSRNEIIQLNGEPFIRQCVGDIVGRESKSEPITINADCGAFAFKCIGQTLTLQTQATSDEKTVQFPDQTIAV